MDLPPWRSVPSTPSQSTFSEDTGYAIFSLASSVGFAHYCGAVGRETLRTVGKILTDIPESRPTDTTTAGYIVSKHVSVSAHNLISKFRGRGLKRARKALGCKKKEKGPKPKKIKRSPRKIIKGTLFLVLFSHNSAADHVCRRRDGVR